MCQSLIKCYVSDILSRCFGDTLQQVSQELKRRQEAQKLQDSEAMPPPPAPPPLPAQHIGSGDPFTQPLGPHDPPEGKSSPF